MGIHSSPCCDDRLKRVICPDCLGERCYSCDDEGFIDETFECVECGEQFTSEELEVIDITEERGEYA